uniref:Uncharacterized protein n=1 Tax=Anguilla anguilla TaxID=7936 RepID=A0A0E9RPD9_ANGAN
MSVMSSAVVTMVTEGHVPITTEENNLRKIVGVLQLQRQKK